LPRNVWGVCPRECTVRWCGVVCAPPPPSPPPHLHPIRARSLRLQLSPPVALLSPRLAASAHRVPMHSPPHLAGTPHRSVAAAAAAGDATTTQDTVGPEAASGAGASGDADYDADAAAAADATVATATATDALCEIPMAALVDAPPAPPPPLGSPDLLPPLPPLRHAVAPAASPGPVHPGGGPSRRSSSLESEDRESDSAALLGDDDGLRTPTLTLGS
jgi:hypothetical protein